MYILRSFSELTTAQLYDVLLLRQEVFIVEQNCVYSDIDGDDHHALHLLRYDENLLSAYLRIFLHGQKFEDASSIGRIIVAEPYRGGTYGEDLIRKGISVCFDHDPNIDIHIEAQYALSDYYSKFGFKKTGSIYLWDGIEHQKMILAAPN
ncbi:MAG: GNAT family N-acetyltransferase [Bacteroidota bacterium]